METKPPLFVKLYILCFFIFNVVGCKNDHYPNRKVVINKEGKKVTKYTDNEPNVYTVEFKKKINTLSEDEKLKNVPSDVSQMYYVDNFELNNYFPKDRAENNVIKFVYPNDKVLVGITFHQIDFFSYLIRQGDSATVQYRNGFPHVKPNNSTYPRFEYSYDSLRRANFNIEGIEAAKQFEFSNKEDLNAFLELKHNDYKSESIFLDSLYSDRLLSKDYYNLMKEKSRFKLLNLYTSYYVVDKTNPVSFPFNREDLNKPDLLNTNFYYRFLHNYVYNVLNKNKGSRSSNGFINNSPLAFDRLLKDTLITDEKVKNSMLTKVLYDINTNFSNDTFQNYFKKFKNNIRDTLIISRVENKLLTKYENLKGIKDKVFITNKGGDVSSLQDLIEDSKQSLIYIDFWASWCTPCLQAMPAASNLREKYKNQNMLFIYMSIDKDKDMWLKALDKVELPVDDSYLVLNYREATFFKNQNLRTIPRYMLFKDGEIIYSNAPGPDSEELIQLINTHLNSSPVK